MPSLTSLMLCYIGTGCLISGQTCQQCDVKKRGHCHDRGREYKNGRKRNAFWTKNSKKYKGHLTLLKLQTLTSAECLSWFDMSGIYGTVLGTDQQYIRKIFKNRFKHRKKYCSYITKTSTINVKNQKISWENCKIDTQFTHVTKLEVSHPKAEEVSMG